MPSCTLTTPLPSGRKLYITIVSDISNASSLLSVHLSLEGKEKRCDDAFLSMVWNQIEEYLHGERKNFSIAVSPNALKGATEFQSAVWEATSRIPYGKIETYGRIAQAIKRPHSSRAVGNALGKNPLPIIVPCHRVVSSSGLGGFSGGGSEVKEYLLSIEKREGL